jgi:hypothetical protein
MGRLKVSQICFEAYGTSTCPGGGRGSRGQKRELLASGTPMDFSQKAWAIRRRGNSWSYQRLPSPWPVAVPIGLPRLYSETAGAGKVSEERTAGVGQARDSTATLPLLSSSSSKREDMLLPKRPWTCAALAGIPSRKTPLFVLWICSELGYDFQRGPRNFTNSSQERQFRSRYSNWTSGVGEGMRKRTPAN